MLSWLLLPVIVKHHQSMGYSPLCRSVLKRETRRLIEEMSEPTYNEDIMTFEEHEEEEEDELPFAHSFNQKYMNQLLRMREIDRYRWHDGMSRVHGQMFNQLRNNDGPLFKRALVNLYPENCVGTHRRPAGYPENSVRTYRRPAGRNAAAAQQRNDVEGCVGCWAGLCKWFNCARAREAARNGDGKTRAETEL